MKVCCVQVVGSDGKFLGQQSVRYLDLRCGRFHAYGDAVHANTFPRQRAVLVFGLKIEQVLNGLSEEIGAGHPTRETEDEGGGRERSVDGEPGHQSMFCPVGCVSVEAEARSVRAHGDTSSAAVDRFSHATLSSSSGSEASRA